MLILPRTKARFYVIIASEYFPFNFWKIEDTSIVLVHSFIRKYAYFLTGFHLHVGANITIYFCSRQSKKNDRVAVKGRGNDK